MSLVKLLTSGRSLIGIDNTASRYKMRERNMLPKFGASRNPFAAREESPKSPAPQSSAPAASPELAPLPRPAAKAGDSRGPTRAAVLPKAGEWIGRCADKINPAAWWQARKPAMKSVARKPDRRPVQTELSLDQVKVARNDLSDADVEVVTARPAAKSGAERMTPAPASGTGVTAEVRQTDHAVNNNFNA
jgi:hypothetical protein